MCVWGYKNSKGAEINWGRQVEAEEVKETLALW